MRLLKNNQNKKYLIYSLIVIFASLGAYLIYANFIGFETSIVLRNSTDNLLNEDYYEYIDLKVSLNDEVIFDDSLKNGLHDTLHVDAKLNFGSNFIEVYSKKANMYAHKIDKIFFSKKYHIIFAESPKKMNYYNLAIH